MGRPVNGTTFMERLMARVERVGECWLVDGRTGQNTYVKLTFRGRLTRAHRAIWQEQCGPIPQGLEVCHRCDQPACVNVAHLFLGTHAENMADMKRKGRSVGHQGENHPRARLNEDIVRAMRNSPESCAALARLYGVTPTMVSFIKRGLSWRHVTL